MSRIEQALKRVDRKTGSGNQERFVSPWSVEKSAPQEGPEDSVSDESTEPLDQVAAQEPILVDEPNRGASLELGSSWRERRATSPDADPLLVEQFRRLAAVMQHAQRSSGLKVLMLTSAAPGDGKTLTALNLSLVLSESYGKRVLLIDADLRRPSLGRMLELNDSAGLGDALKSPTNEKLSVVQITPTFTLLPGGQPDPDPISRITSERMRHILDEASARFDWVILDSPPMGPTADAQFLARMVDGIVFVIRAGKTRHADVEKAINTLGRERILGVILNGIENMPPGTYEYAAGNYPSGVK